MYNTVVTKHSTWWTIFRLREYMLYVNASPVVIILQVKESKDTDAIVIWLEYTYLSKILISRKNNSVWCHAQYGLIAKIAVIEILLQLAK